jgi:outer membrane murein-binding lipoprotein Lpp
LAAEAVVKLGVNVLISGAAIAALAQLIPYSVSQQTKLKEIQAEVNTTDTRVARLKTDFNRYFDPRQAAAIAQEQTNRADPNQRVVVLEPTTQAPQSPPQNP